MTEKIIVCVAAKQVLVGVVRHARHAPCEQLAPGEAGHKAFGELLLAHPGAPVYIMVDSVDEDYHTETLPHSVGRVRGEMLQRKLKQVYRNTFYSTAWLQGREPDKRRDDRYLFAALTNVDLLRPWLEILRSLGAPLVGIYLLPMVTQILLQRLNVSDTDLLVVSQHGSGLRQSFFHGGQLRASRLALADQTSGGNAASLAVEVGKTRLYLNSLRLVSRDTRLNVLLLDGADTLGELQVCLEADGGLACHRLAGSEVSARIGLALADCPYSLHMTALAIQQPAHNLAPETFTRTYRNFQHRRQIYVASAVALGFAVVWSGGNLLQQYLNRVETRQLQTQTAEQNARYAEVTKTFPSSPASADSLEKAVRLAERIRRGNRDPERLMNTVSRALQANGEIMLMRLSWRHGGADGNADKTGPVSPSDPAASESGQIEGEVRPFQGDYRAAMASIERFAAALRAERGVAMVNVVQMPLNVRSASTLSGNTTDAVNTDGVRAEFKLLVQLKEEK